MIEINLVPDVKQELLRARRIRARVIAASLIIGIISLAVVGLLAVYIFTVQTVRNNMIDQDIKTGSDKLLGIDELSKTLTIQNQLVKISSLNSQKGIYSRLFSVFKAINPPAPNNIQISNLAIDSTSGQISMDGQAANSYSAVEIFKKTILAAQFKYTDASGQVSDPINLASNISTSSMSYARNASGNRVLRFSMSFDYASELFAETSKDVVVSVDAGGDVDVTDSHLGIPADLFVAPATTSEVQ